MRVMQIPGFGNVAIGKFASPSDDLQTFEIARMIWSHHMLMLDVPHPVDPRAWVQRLMLWSSEPERNYYPFVTAAIEAAREIVEAKQRGVI
jgi:hypothetical protein